MAARWIKENELANALEEPANDSVIASALKKLIAAKIWVNCALVVYFALKD